MKKLCLHDIRIHSKIVIHMLEWFRHKGGLILPWMILKVILHFIKKNCLHNIDKSFKKIGRKTKKVILKY